MREWDGGSKRLCCLPVQMSDRRVRPRLHDTNNNAVDLLQEVKELAPLLAARERCGICMLFPCTTSAVHFPWVLLNSACRKAVASDAWVQSWSLQCRQQILPLLDRHWRDECRDDQRLHAYASLVIAGKTPPDVVEAWLRRRLAGIQQVNIQAAEPQVCAVARGYWAEHSRICNMCASSVVLVIVRVSVLTTIRASCRHRASHARHHCRGWVSGFGQGRRSLQPSVFWQRPRSWARCACPATDPSCPAEL